jgi:hypothetical protein
MQLRQHRSNVQNIVLIFSDESRISKVHLPIQVEKDCAGYVQIILLPDSFLSVIGALPKKNIQFSEFDSLLLAHLAVKGDKSLAENTRQFPAEETANFYCIDHKIRCYIMFIAMAPFDLKKEKVRC